MTNELKYRCSGYNEKICGDCQEGQPHTYDNCFHLRVSSISCKIGKLTVTCNEYTNEQIKCPVCGDREFAITDREKYYSCKGCGLELPAVIVEGYMRLIDKAVIAERERVDKDLNQMELFYQDSCPQNKLSCHATILSTIKEARKVVVKGIQQFNVT